MVASVLAIAFALVAVNTPVEAATRRGRQLTVAGASMRGGASQRDRLSREDDSDEYDQDENLPAQGEDGPTDSDAPPVDTEAGEDGGRQDTDADDNDADARDPQDGGVDDADAVPVVAAAAVPARVPKRPAAVVAAQVPKRSAAGGPTPRRATPPATHPHPHAPWTPGRSPPTRNTSSGGQAAEVSARVTGQARPALALVGGLVGAPFQRPHAGGPADVVYFGILCKTFYGADVKTGTFSADLVVTTRWTDSRTSSLVRDGLKSVALPTKKAAGKMWLPDTAITNRAKGGTDIISSQIFVSKSGEVTKVERVLANVKNKFDLSAFPYDEQVMKVRLASTAMMLDEVVLKPLTDPDATGIKDGIFEGKDLDFVSTKTVAFDDEQGLLRKSRGELNIVVQRNIVPYSQTMITPKLVLMVLSWTVFFFPVQPGFIMPRVATSMISFLALMTLSLKTDSMLPARSGATWIDLFEETCRTLVFFTLILNIFIEFVIHDLDARPVAEELKQPKLGVRLQNELKIGLPVLALLAMLVLFLRANADSLWWQALLIRSVFVVFFVVFFVSAGLREMRILRIFNPNVAKTPRPEEEAASAPAARP